MSTDLPIRIQKFNANREQHALPLKYKAMSESPFRFFRGTCHLFYEDLLKAYPFPPSPLTWICGDLHIENFGSYKGENRLVYFDMNDFDEAIQAPVLYEISRLLVSVVLAITEIGSSKKEEETFVQQLLHHYRHTLLKHKSQNIEGETATGLIKKLIDTVSQRKEKDLLVKRTNYKSENAKLLPGDRLLELPKEERKLLATAFTEWFGNSYHKGYRVTDAGFRIAGTGSIGVKRWLFLLEKETHSKQKRLIDVKQSLPSSILPYANLKQPAWQNEAERIITVQEIMQHVAPAFLSAFQYQGDWFAVKEIQPTADKISIDQAVKQPRLVEQYLSDLGIITASAQLRSSGRYKTATADELKDFAQDQGWEKGLTEWAVQYADQVKRDYSIFCKARKDGFFNT